MANFIFITYRPDVSAAVNSATVRALEIMGGKAESYAKEAAPVDTGNLRNSISHKQVGNDTEVIGTNVEYAPYQEFGTYKMAAHPFLRPAAENHSAEYAAIWQGELGSIG